MRLLDFTTVADVLIATTQYAPFGAVVDDIVLAMKQEVASVQLAGLQPSGVMFFLHLEGKEEVEEITLNEFDLALTYPNNVAMSRYASIMEQVVTVVLSKRYLAWVVDNKYQPSTAIDQVVSHAVVKFYKAFAKNVTLELIDRYVKQP